MAEKVIIVGDPGIATAFAIALALREPTIEVLALIASPGNVGHDQATRNCHTILEQLDPAKWPRIGAALPIHYDREARDLNGTDGLGGLDFPCVRLHHPHSGDRLLCELARQYAGEITLLVMGPTTMVARAMDRDGELINSLSRMIIVGGTRHEPGDAGPVSEFHFWCDPSAAQQVLHSGVPVMLLPLDVTRKLILSPADIRNIGKADTPTAAFLGRVLSAMIVPTAGMFGIEGVWVSDALAVAALVRPTLFTIKGVAVDVEQRGELTRGMSVIDQRWGTGKKMNVDLAVDVDVGALRKYVQGVLM
jgi:inosine-uridine nucleoside N-ribohydrolase